MKDKIKRLLFSKKNSFTFIVLAVTFLTAYYLSVSGYRANWTLIETVFFKPRYYNCTNVFRPNLFHLKQVQFWQNLTYRNNNTTTPIYIHKFYLDNRKYKANEVRSFILTRGTLNVTDIYCSLWFINVSNPVAVLGRITNVQTSIYKIDNVALITYLVACPVSHPRELIKYDNPSHVSLQFNQCDEPITYIEVVIPELRESQNNDQISVCMTAQYGHATDDDTPFLIQWIELLVKFGVSKIMIYKGTMEIKGESYKRALDYYIDKEVLIFEEFPVPFAYDPSQFRAEYNIVEAIRSLAVNDCFYRQMNKNWYILHIDKDELVIPKKFKTYQEVLRDILENDEYLKIYKDRKKIASLSVFSAFYYRNAIKNNKRVPSYLPMLHYTYRQPIEPVVKSVGYAKSFVSTRYCNHLWSHRCILAGDNEFIFVPEDSIMIHHYRDSCPRDIKSVREPKDGYCDTEEERQFEDDYIGRNYREYLVERTMKVLKHIGYKF